MQSLVEGFPLVVTCFSSQSIKYKLIFSSHHNSCKNKNVNTFLLLESYNLEKKTLHCDALEKRIDLTIC